jgi:hypothetical protein
MFAILRGIYGRFTSGKVKRTSTEGAQPGTRPYFAAVQQVRGRDGMAAALADGRSWGGL